VRSDKAKLISDKDLSWKLTFKVAAMDAKAKYERNLTGCSTRKWARAEAISTAPAIRMAYKKP
jgi:hypothetical protein